MSPMQRAAQLQQHVAASQHGPLVKSAASLFIHLETDMVATYG